MNKLSKILLAIILGLLILMLLIISSKDSSNKPVDYDISMMREVTVHDVLEMFSSKETYVLYVGRKSCSVCVKILPALKEAQIKNNYITQYLDIEKVDRTSDEWYELKAKLTMKSTQTLTEDGSGEEITETYGYFLHEYGFTPTVMVIKNGKQVAGLIGGAEKNLLVDWLSNKVN
ncbi:MAG: hypothetical protein E7164_00340 [Firmicutes bacterium]|nr:hypothetical protein [Bacillota bacterium]